MDIEMTEELWVSLVCESKKQFEANGLDFIWDDILTAHPAGPVMIIPVFSRGKVSPLIVATEEALVGIQGDKWDEIIRKVKSV